MSDEIVGLDVEILRPKDWDETRDRLRWLKRVDQIVRSWERGMILVLDPPAGNEIADEIAQIVGLLPNVKSVKQIEGCYVPDAHAIEETVYKTIRDFAQSLATVEKPQPTAAGVLELKLRVAASRELRKVASMSWFDRDTRVGHEIGETIVKAIRQYTNR